MVLQALTRFYDILAQDPGSGIAPAGYCVARVSHALNLAADGRLLDIFPLVSKERFGNKIVDLSYRRMMVPEQVKRSGTNPKPNFLCDSCAYVLGISERDENDPEYARRRFEAFRKFHLELLTHASGTAALAVTAFLDSYNPQQGAQNPPVANQLDGLYQASNLVFKLDGQGGFIHEDPEIRQIWGAYLSGGNNEFTGQCLVTGEIQPIARLHPSIKGVAEATSSGATLVGFNARAYESYNRTKEQGLNSPVSEQAAFAYTTVLNYLLSPANPNRKLSIGDATVIYWAESSDPTYADIVSSLFEPEFLGQPEDVSEGTLARDRPGVRRMGEIAEKVRRGAAVDTSTLLEGLNPNTRFYILGLSPNAARLSVRFFHQDAFEKIVMKIMAHYADIQIQKEYEDQPDWVSVRRIVDETVSKFAADKTASPLMVGAVMRAVLNATPYPEALFTAVITRIRADSDNKQKRIKKVNTIRAGIIKAYLTRKYRNLNNTQIKEVLCMGLNEQSTNRAYLLGRLFAVLEKAQRDAIGDPNASITDRYFTSACASPVTVFPVLLRLSRHHISKAKYGYMSDRRIEEITNLLDVENRPFPAHLSLDEQGVFILGYYHQRSAFYVRKENGEPAEPELPVADEEGD